MKKIKHRKTRISQSSPPTPIPPPESIKVDVYNDQIGDFEVREICTDQIVIVRGHRIDLFMPPQNGSSLFMIRSIIIFEDGRLLAANNPASEFIGICKVQRLPYPFEKRDWRKDLVTLHVDDRNDGIRTVELELGEIEYIFTSTKGLVITNDNGEDMNGSWVNAFAVLRVGKKLPLRDDISAFEKLPLLLEYRP